MIGPAIEGLMVTSTVRGAGKTCLIAGLASSLIQQGFTVQAIKPLEVEALNTHRPDYQTLQHSSNTSCDQDFLNKATRAMQQIDPIWVDIPQQITPLLWSRVIDICRRTAFPTLIEAPGIIASSFRSLENGRHWGAMTWANQLGIPLLLVTPKTTNLIADTAPALAYLLYQLSQQLGGASSPQFLNSKCIGWVAVESTPPTTPLPYFDEECLFLSQEYRIPFLGTLPFSPRISVPENQAGNLAELVGAEIDLLPVQQALKVFV
jgi:dethiobiotin synthetase